MYGGGEGYPTLGDTAERAKIRATEKRMMRKEEFMKRAMVAGGAIVLTLISALAQHGIAQAQQKSMNDEGGRILALEKAWNHALEEKDAKALDMLLANTLVSVDIDGSVASKSEFLASI